VEYDRKVRRGSAEGVKMRRVLLTLGLSLIVITAATAGKNADGALVVHTDDAHSYTGANMCLLFDSWYPGITCADLGTRTDRDETTPALIWFIAAFPQSSTPGVQIIYFGNEHNLPPGEGYHANWGYCGPGGSFELPDSGWPEAPATAGNSLTFDSPIVGDILFPFYYVNVYGFAGAYYGTGIHPVLGYAAFLDDSDYRELDEVWRFGKVCWYRPGYAICPDQGPEYLVACCFEDGVCWHALERYCSDQGGQSLGLGTDCNPNPCPQGGPGVCCLESGACVLAPPLECDAVGGMYLGEEPDCDPNPCPQPIIGVCCTQNGGCSIVTEPDCAESGGTWFGEMQACDPNPCMGACCFYDGSCQMQSEYWCEPMGGDYMGGGTDCDPNPCVPSGVPENMIHETTWGSIKATYR